MKIKMKTLIDGIFYVNYWRFMNSNPNLGEKLEIAHASLAITAPSILYFILFIGICGINNYTIFMTKSTFFICYAIYNILGIIYFFCRYKNIITEHDKYNNKKYKIITWLFYGSIFFSLLIGTYLLYLSNTR